MPPAGTSTHREPGPIPFPIPYGWFSAGYSDEFAQTQVTPVHYVGRDLIVWRDDAGVAHVQDAYCPHLGAHIGIGGTVEGTCLRCPFHGWMFDSEGRNVDIPYSQRTNAKARLRTYQVVERNHMVMFWWHPDPEQQPMWEVPDYGIAETGFAERYSWDVATHWQEVAENGFDMAHFMFVHGLSEVGTLGTYEFDGYARRGVSNQKFNTSKGVFDGTITVDTSGPGLGRTDFHVIGHASLISSATPIDRLRLRARFAWVYGDDDISARIGPVFSAEVKRQFEQDMPIWENKAYLDPPSLAAPEQAIAEFRRWARQFYVEV